MTNTQPCSKRLFWIDALRLGLALCIAVLHFNWKYLPQAYLAVEVFFMLGGMFFFLHYDFADADNSWQRVKNRLISVWKYFAVAFLVFTLCHPRFPSASHLGYVLLGWSYIGLGPMWGPGAYWFIGVYIYVCLLYVLLFRLFPANKLVSFVSLIVLGGIGLLYNNSPAHNLNETLPIVLNFSFGFWRGVVAFGLGILLGKAARMIKTPFSPRRALFFLVLLLSAAAYIFLRTPPTPHYDYLWYIIAACLVLCCYCLPNPRYFKFSKDALLLPLVVYLFHPVVIEVLTRYNFRIHLSVYLVLVLIVSWLVIKCKKVFSAWIKFASRVKAQ